MAATSHQLAIAKASLTAALLRADPVPVAREEITHFHQLLDTALAVCSPTNIQKCKRWVLKNMNSQARITSLGKYLVALSPSFPDIPTPKATSARRKRLNVLFLINDLLHHTKYNEPDDSFAQTIKGVLGPLFAVAIYPKAVKQLARVERLLSIWEEKSYYPRPFVEELRTISKSVASATSSSSLGSNDAVAGAAGSSEKMLLLPPFHGDPSLPFYDLPAANMLPLLNPNSTTPINPRLLRPIQFAKITPDASLASAVKDFLNSVDAMYSGKDIDEELDAVGGTEGEGYYGWSRSFCEKMKQKKKAAVEEARAGRSRSGTKSRRDDDRGRRRYSYSSYSSDQSRSRSQSGRRRQRSSTSDSRSRSRSPKRYRPRSNSGSRSRSASPRARASFEQFQPAQKDPQNPTVPSGNTGIPPSPLPSIVPPNLSQLGMQFGFAQQPQFAQGPQNWPPLPPPPPPNAGFPPFQPNAMMAQQLQQHFQQFGYPQMPNYGGGMGAPWPQQQGFQQPPQQLQQQPQSQRPQQPTGSGYAYGADGQGGAGGSSEAGFDDYRSVKGREIGAKRGWKT